MEYSTFLNVVREFEKEDSFPDVLYLEALKKLRKVREDQQELTENMARRTRRNKHP